MKKTLPKNSEGLIGLLDSLLRLNPFFRASASEALKFIIFDEVRDKSLEKSAPCKISLAIDRDEAFDYEEGISKKYKLKDYKQLLLETVDKVHSHRKQYLAGVLNSDKLLEKV